jgi:predicted enzyme related to lactoylglutathione lyase
MGDGNVYTIFKKDDRDAAALYQMGKEQTGMPPHWGSYVAVASADEAAALATTLGARVAMAPFDVMESGRMAVIQDPQGAFVAVWQARQHPGIGVVDEPGALCWTELMTNDIAAAGRFYNALFGWTTETKRTGPQPYIVFKRDGMSKAGMTAITPEMGPLPPNWLSYFAVRDTDAMVAKAIMLRGSVVAQPMDIPDVGRFAVLHDPQGATFAILGEARKA